MLEAGFLHSDFGNPDCNAEVRPIGDRHVGYMWCPVCTEKVHDWTERLIPA